MNGFHHRNYANSQVIRASVANFNKFLGVALGGMLMLLRSPVAWAVLGAAWSACLLGFWSYGGLLSFTSAAAPQFPIFFPFQVVSLLGVVVMLVVHALQLRSDSAQP